MLDSNKTYRFLQPLPEIGQPRCRSWKTWNGYLYNSKVLTQCLLQNGRQFTWHVVYKFEADLTEQDHSKLMKAITTKCKRSGYSGAWIREIGDDDRIHYHLLFLDQGVSRETLKAAVPKAFRNVSNVRMQRVKNQFGMAFYFTKARIAGSGMRDKYVAKRRLFKTDIKLDKTGSFGDFWRKPKDDLYKEVIEREAAIASFKTDEVTAQSYTLHELIDGYVKRAKIERNLASQLMNEAKKKSEKNL